MADSIMRHDKTTDNWVIFSTQRRKRPRELRQEKKRVEDIPAHDRGCPFCPGNEHMLDEIIMQGGEGDYGTWLTRVVPNKFPALVPQGGRGRREEGIYLAMDGFGRHEVLIENPMHNLQMALLSGDAVRGILETYHTRYLRLMDEEDNMMVLIFRNHGPKAGTSLIHPHSQIIATSIVPWYIRFREEKAQAYHDKWGRCVYCDILSFEAEERRRIIHENSSFVGFIPFAAEVPFEIWIVPRRHRADFGSITVPEKDDLTEILRKILGVLFERLNDPDYNYVIHTAPRYKAGEPHIHWFIRIRPRLTTQAGFEIGSGMSINPSMPEDDADFLRKGGRP